MPTCSRSPATMRFAAFTLIPTGADAVVHLGLDRALRAGLGRRQLRRLRRPRSRPTARFLAFASIVQLDLEARQGEIGYAVAPAARGRGVARRSVALLTRWGFDELGLIRLVLDIDVANPASERVAERAGYRLEGVRRSAYFKEGRRADVGRLVPAARRSPGALGWRREHSRAAAPRPRGGDLRGSRRDA